MLITSPFWIAATVAETYSRVATMIFWGALVPTVEVELAPVEAKIEELPEVEPLAEVEPLPLAA
ncbi:MAG: hypothetical protein M9932_01885 [Xanthobacteraceae bacterium]|nr:hypothetical protein [Xanthobacteraceae bacterium]